LILPCPMSRQHLGNILARKGKAGRSLLGPIHSNIAPTERYCNVNMRRGILRGGGTHHMQMQSLYDVYQTLPDSRTASGKRFNQAGVLALITLALVAQQNSLRQMSAWVAACDPALGARLGFRFERMPSYGTIRRVLLALDLTVFRHALAQWAHSLTRTLPVTDAPPSALVPLAVDGKTLRGSADEPDLPAVRLLSAFVHDLGVNLAQVPIPATTTEAKTLTDLLTTLVLDGTIITGDAHYTTREVIATLREKRGTTCCVSKTINRGCFAR
jgi:hypothetical protein